MSVYDVFVGGNVPGSCGSASPRSNRASRPLSAVFQSLQPPSLWRNRKSNSPLTQVHTQTLTFTSQVMRYVILRVKKSLCVQVSVGAEGSTMSGSLQRRKKSKRKWKRLWFLLKDKVLYTFKAREVRGPRVSHTNRHYIMYKQILLHTYTHYNLHKLHLICWINTKISILIQHQPLVPHIIIKSIA